MGCGPPVGPVMSSKQVITQTCFAKNGLFSGLSSIELDWVRFPNVPLPIPGLKQKAKPVGNLEKVVVIA